MALTLMMLLLSTLVVKPVHVAFAHHDDRCYNHAANSATLSHKDCDICQFVFSHYTPQQAGDFKPFVFRPYITLGDRVCSFNSIQTASYVSLRAPPTLLS